MVSRPLWPGDETGQDVPGHALRYQRLPARAGYPRTSDARRRERRASGARLPGDLHGPVLLPSRLGSAAFAAKPGGAGHGAVTGG